MNFEFQWSSTMRIIKRDGTSQELSFDKILYRVKNLCNDESLGKLDSIDYDVITQRVIASIYDGVTSSELDEEAARICASITTNVDYKQLSSRIIISNMHKNTPDSFSEACTLLHSSHVISDDHYRLVLKNKELFDSMIIHPRDYLFDYFGYKTLEKSYLLKINGKIIERPQYLYLRVAIAIHRENTDNILETYNLLSQHYYTHASPTLFNAGTKKQSLSSCFLLGTNDSMDSIYKTISDCARISRLGGGIGVHISNIRAKGTPIKGVNGISDGIVPMLKVYNETAAYVNQGSKRKGSFAIYLEPWHAEILDFLDLKKNQGAEERRARNLFYAIWTPDYFMRQVECDGDWYLMCPNQSPGLHDVHSEEFDKMYDDYISKGLYTRKIKAREIWNKILDAQIESGVPYITYKDAANKKFNQKNLGTAKSSNLCVAPETMILTDSGYHTIKELDNKQVRVWNGEEFTNTTIVKTGENQELVKISFSNGSILECTLYHKFHILNDKGNVDIIEAKDLLEGMNLIKTSYPILDGDKRFTIVEEQFLTRNGIPIFSDVYPNIINPPVNYSLDSKIKWFDSVCQHSTFNTISNYIFIYIKPRDVQFLQDIKYMLQTMGCNPHVKTSTYSLKLDYSDIETLYHLGFKSDRLTRMTTRVPKPMVRVTDVKFTGIISDTYCFKEEKRGLGIFNGVITGQCNEIILYSDDSNYAVCNLCSIALPKFVKYDNQKKPYFDFDHLHSVATSTVLAMNNVIDNNEYPTPETKKTDDKNRPLGIGVQGLVDVYIQMRFPFESKEAAQLNKEIFECLYHGLVQQSIELAKTQGPYSTFDGSPFSQGKLQFDLAKDFDNINLDDYISGRYDWDTIKADIKRYGIRNSMLTALMPTASTAQIMGNSESFEVMNSCIFKRRVLSGEFVVLNKYLVKDLTELGLWNETMKNKLIIADGSIQTISEIPQSLKDLYKTAWEISMKAVINQCRDRGVFIDQTQSMNLYMANPTIKKLSSMHFYAWKNHLKTGIYYLRSKSVASSGKFSVDPEMEKQSRDQELTLQCSIDNKEDCIMCSS